MSGKKHGSRRDRGAPWGVIPGAHPEPTWIGINVTCARGGHKPQRWKIHRDLDGEKAGQVWFHARPDRTLPEQVDALAEHPRLVFVCPMCRHHVVWTLEETHRRFDAVVASGRRVATYPL